MSRFFFFNDTATTEIYTLSLHDALPISLGQPRGPVLPPRAGRRGRARQPGVGVLGQLVVDAVAGLLVARRVDHRGDVAARGERSEEHTSELQSRQYLVCRLLLEKKKQNK